MRGISSMVVLVALGCSGPAADVGHRDTIPDPGRADQAPPQPRSRAPLPERLSRHVIDTAQTPASIPGYLASFAFLVQMPDGSFRLGWNHERDLHIARLDRDLDRVPDADIVIRDHVLAQLAPHPDGSLLAAVIPFQEHLFNAFKTPLAVDIVKLDTGGRALFRTRVVGGEGIAGGKVWHAYSPTNAVRLAVSGEHIGAFIKVSKNFGSAGSPDTHQGDLFVVLDRHGALQPARTVLWSASHSNMLQLATGADGHFLTLTVGDAYPFGIYFIDRDTKKSAIVWPDEDQRTPEIVKAAKSVAGAGNLCGFLRRGAALYASIGTVRRLPYDGYQHKADALLVEFAADGSVTRRTWLTDTAERAESCPFLAPYGDALLIASAEREDNRAHGRATLMVVAPDGAVLEPAQTVDARLPSWNGEVIALADGGVAWAVVDYQAREIVIHRLAR